MAENVDPTDDRSTREIGTDILVRLARIEGLLDGYLLALGARRPAEVDQPDGRPE